MSENMGTKIRNTRIQIRTNTGAPPPWTVVFLSGVVTLNWAGKFSLQTCLLALCRQDFLLSRPVSWRSVGLSSSALKTCLLTSCRPVFWYLAFYRLVFWSADLSSSFCRPFFKCSTVCRSVFFRSADLLLVLCISVLCHSADLLLALWEAFLLSIRRPVFWRSADLLIFFLSQARLQVLSNSVFFRSAKLPYVLTLYLPVTLRPIIDLSTGLWRCSRSRDLYFGALQTCLLTSCRPTPGVL
jgi:hypothetical protein